MTQSTKIIAPPPLAGLIAGALCGLIAAAAMSTAQAAFTTRFGETAGDDDPSTVKAANRISRAATGAAVPDRDAALAGELVHYALGAALGAAYGVATEYRGEATLGFAAAYGASIALVLDDMIVPAVGLAEPPNETSLGSHAFGLASHLLFGVTLEGARRMLKDRR